MRVKLPMERRLKASKQVALDALAEAKAIEKMRKYDSLAIDLVIYGAIVTLVEDFDWGSRKDSTRVRRFIDGVSERIGLAGERYGDDCVLTALRAKVRSYGFNFSFSDEP